MMPKMLEGTPGKPGPAPKNFSALEFVAACNVDAEGEDWPEADLRSVIHYLRGSKLLLLSSDLKSAFPKRV